MFGHKKQTKLMYEVEYKLQHTNVIGFERIYIPNDS